MDAWRLLAPRSPHASLREGESCWRHNTNDNRINRYLFLWEMITHQEQSPRNKHHQYIIIIIIIILCSDLGHKYRSFLITFMLPRFFVQTHIFSVSPSSFSL